MISVDQAALKYTSGQSLVASTAGAAPRRIKCRYCGQRFELTGSVRYCSATCRARAARLAKARWRRKQGEHRKTCLTCGVVFVAQHCNALTCSSKCRQSLYRRTRKNPALKAERRHVGRKERLKRKAELSDAFIEALAQILGSGGALQN